MQVGYGQAQEIEAKYDNSTSPDQDCPLHPLIYISLRFARAQDIAF